MNIKALASDVEDFAEKARGELESLLARHRQTIDDDLAAAVEAASVLPPWARTMVASVVTGLADSLMKGIEGDKAAIVPPAGQAVTVTAPAASGHATTMSEVPEGGQVTVVDDDASPSQQAPVSDS